MCSRCTFLAGVGAFAAAPALASARTGDPAYLEIAFSGMRRVANTVWLGQLTPNVWVFTTTEILDGDTGYYPANGAIVVDGSEALIIDPGWRPEHATILLDAWRQLKLAPITQGLVTHFHRDRIGGLPVLRSRGVPAYGNPLTIGLAMDSGFVAPSPLHEVQKHPARLGGVEVFYPGPGHTLDNVVAWVPSDGVLFGGCLVKSTTAAGLGNVADADIPVWPTAMRTLAARYPYVKRVIPGHGTVSGDSLAHTLVLAIAGKA